MDCKEIVSRLYKALAAADIQTLSSLLSSELEWWFHGPPREQHLMRMLTGVDRLGSFSFVPLRVDAIDEEKVIGEGQGVDGGGKMFCWVHVWTLNESRLVHLREYYNTSVTVSGSARSEVFGRGESCSKLLPGLVLAV